MPDKATVPHDAERRPEIERELEMLGSELESFTDRLKEGGESICALEDRIDTALSPPQEAKGKPDSGEATEDPGSPLAKQMKSLRKELKKLRRKYQGQVDKIQEIESRVELP